MVVYKIVNTLNGMIYVGQTKRNLDERMREHYRKNITPIDKAIHEIGRENFKAYVIEECTSQNELYEREEYWINKLNTIFPNGYNRCNGGKTSKGYKHTSESKEKMRKAREGMYLGIDNPFYGKHHSEEQKAKWKKDRQGRKPSEKALEESLKARQRKVVNLETGEIFNSIKEASEKYSIPSTHITRVCKGKRKRTGGYHWSYV